MANNNRQQRVRGLMDRIKDGIANNPQIQAIKKGLDETPENTRASIYSAREKDGLSDPTRIAEVAADSQIGVAYRELASAYGLPGGFTDKMLMERAQAGLGIGGKDPRKGRTKQNLADIFTVNQDELQGKQRDMNDHRSTQEIIKDAEDLLHQQADDYRTGLRQRPFSEQVAGAASRVANDVNLDRSRAAYWLLNASQATTSMLNEVGSAFANPNLLTSRLIANERLERAAKDGLIKRVGSVPLANYSRKKVDTGTAAGYNEVDPLPNSGPPKTQTLDEFTAQKEYDDVGPSILDNPANYEAIHPSVKQVTRKNKDGTADVVFQQRRLNKNLQTFGSLAAGSVAVNAGIGLYGRHDGYEMSVPDEIDPRDTDNIVWEVGSRYLLSRPGDLMNKEDFKLERIDATDGEYNRYKGYLRSKDLDVNPLDGDFNLGGLVKGTTEGVRGPELNLFYRSLPLHDTLMPIAGAIGGVIAGGLLPNIRQLRLKGSRANLRNKPIAKGRVKGTLDRVYRSLPEVAKKEFDGSSNLHNSWIPEGSKRDKATKWIEDLFGEKENALTGRPDINVGAHIGSMATGGALGLIGASTVGNNIEDERRRRRFNEKNEGVDYDLFKANAQQVLDKKYERLRLNPPKEGESKWAPSRTAQQEVLLTTALEQQTIVDQITDPITKQRAQRELDKSFAALEEINELEAMKGQPYES